MVKTSPSNAGGVGSIPGCGARIPHASRPKKKTKQSTVKRILKVKCYMQYNDKHACWHMFLKPESLQQVGETRERDPVGTVPVRVTSALPRAPASSSQASYTSLGST